MMLPCSHQISIVDQIRPTIELLTNLDEWHPDILLQHAIQPADYRNGLVFRSAIESIRGSYAASSTTQREELVQEVLEQLRAGSRIVNYEHTGSKQRYDFVIAVQRDPDYFVALEVKGGEGNSINISERPLWAREFGVWCHLDGAVINQPAHGAHSVVNRLANEMTRRDKRVDVLFFKDMLCGTNLRLCPKYALSKQLNSHIAPDVFLFPQRPPTLSDPEPPTHTLDTLRLPGLILERFGVAANVWLEHVWFVHVKILSQGKQGQVSRVVEVWHQGEMIDSSRSRSWRVADQS